jgi:hypothetical protein
MCLWSKITRKANNDYQGLKLETPGKYLKDYNEKNYKMTSRFDLELIERTLGLEEKKHNFNTKKEFDKAQIIFSRILMAAAILTLGLILLSSFEIPYVHVSSEYVKLMINAVIVEIAGIVSLGLMKHLAKED